MKCTYDLHIHSSLSPCADDDMTPVTIVGLAKAIGLDFVAIADHNAIDNVEVALTAGEFYGINVVPAVEIQTEEEIHILCLFKTLGDLQSFVAEIEFMQVKNRPEIFGNQLIVDEDDTVVGEKSDLLLVSALISSDDLPELARKYDGVAIPAHIDREANGMLQILGDVSGQYNSVEFSPKADETLRAKWQLTHQIITDSDAHVARDIFGGGSIELEECTTECLIEKLK